MKKILKWVGGILLVAFALLQVTNPARTNPPFNPADDLLATNVPPSVAALLRASCYDCHSSQTRWPWYAHVAPVSWLVVKDTDEGRETLNFSEWPHDNPARAAKRLDAISEAVQYGEMPPKKYTLIHRDAILTEAQRKEISDWADAESERLRASIKEK